MNDIPRSVKTSIGAKVGARLVRIAEKQNRGDERTSPLPGNIKAAERQVSRMRKLPYVVAAAAVEVKGQIRIVTIHRVGAEMVTHNEGGDVFKAPAVIYLCDRVEARKGRVVASTRHSVAFLPHAITRWAQRAAGVDPRRPDVVLLKQLDAEAITLNRQLIMKGGNWPVISTRAKGVWIIRKTTNKNTSPEDADDIVPVSNGSCIVATFYGPDILRNPGPLSRYYDGEEFEDASQLVKVVDEGTAISEDEFMDRARVAGLID